MDTMFVLPKQIENKLEFVKYSTAARHLLTWRRSSDTNSRLKTVRANFVVIWSGKREHIVEMVTKSR